MDRFKLKNDVYKAFWLMLIATLSFAIMSLLVKFESSTTDNNIILFFRFIVSFIFVLISFSVQKISDSSINLKTRHLKLHLLRTFFSAGALYLLFFSFKYIKITNGNILIMTNTLFLPIVAILVLRIRTKVYVIFSTILGFIGTLLVIKPDIGILDVHSLYALLAGLFSACSMISIRELAKRDKSHIIVFYYFLLSTIFSGILASFDWKLPNFRSLLILIGVGLFGTIYQECVTRASKYAEASTITTLSYLVIIFSGVFDWIFFKNIPNFKDIIGIIIIMLSSLIIIKFGSARTHKEIQ